MNVMDLTCWWLSTAVPTHGFVFMHGQVGTIGMWHGEVAEEEYGQVGLIGLKVGQVG